MGRVLSTSKSRCLPSGVTSDVVASFGDGQAGLLSFPPLGHGQASPSTWVCHPDPKGWTRPFFMAQLKGPAMRKSLESLAGWALPLLSLLMVLWFGLYCFVLNYGFGSHSIATLACDSSLSLTRYLLPGEPPLGQTVSILPGWSFQ